MIREGTAPAPVYGGQGGGREGISKKGRMMNESRGKELGTV